jgi:hypothetical protein
MQVLLLDEITVDLDVVTSSLRTLASHGMPRTPLRASPSPSHKSRANRTRLCDDGSVYIESCWRKELTDTKQIMLGTSWKEAMDG